MALVNAKSSGQDRRQLSGSSCFVSWLLITFLGKQNFVLCHFSLSQPTPHIRVSLLVLFAHNTKYVSLSKDKL